MPSKREVRAQGFELLRRQLEHVSCDELRERLRSKRFSKAATMARQLLRERGEPE